MTSRPSDVLLAWAAVGSRVSGYNHDSASKLQSLMMALDEASELGGDPVELARALETATTAVKELHGLLTENRALTKAPVPRAVELASLVQRAANRHGIKLRGELGAATVNVAPPSTVHALALLLDVIAGVAASSRGVDVQLRPSPGSVLLVVTGQPPPSSALDSIEIATWMIEREGGRVQSAPAGFHVELPTP